MPRAIVTGVLHSTKGSSEVDTYFDKVVKYIPADVVGGWVAANGIIKSAYPRPGMALLWIVFLVGLLLCIGWTYKETAKTNKAVAKVQTLVSAGAFLVWVYALGGPFPDWLGWYQPVTGSLLLIAYTLLVPIVNPD